MNVVNPSVPVSDNVLISIVLPVYNSGRYLHDCLKSIVSQTHSNIEIILVDDGSTDDSLSICKLWQSQDQRINVIHQKNMGVGAARNQGMSYAHGDFILFIDPDDILLRNSAIEEALSRSFESHCEIVIFGFSEIDVQGQILFKRPEPQFPSGSFDSVVACENLFKLKLGNYIWRLLIKSSLLFDGKIRFPNFKTWEDLAIYPQILLSAQRIYFLDESMYGYRLHLNQQIQNQSIDIAKDMFRALCYRREFINQISNNLDVSLSLLCQSTSVDYAVLLYRSTIRLKSSKMRDNLLVKIKYFIRDISIEALRSSKRTSYLQVQLIRFHLLNRFTVLLIEKIRHFKNSHNFI